MLPFSAFCLDAITAEVDAVSRCHDFGSPVPFCHLQSNNVTTLSSTGSQQGVDLADTVNAVNRCCANVELMRSLWAGWVSHGKGGAVLGVWWEGST